ncbi:MAG TPA: acyl-CoA dehydrogenase [Amaricoccus sp.]|uniref:acyl-CoA dehydrogenase n=1 Tax=Amaricoccus sp. TaxID=1872485 RepID=UPI002BEE77A0|nr:acyl-CoA dehydrogenase [Amaricoccus sp.]HMQ92638.1 acyl-CoA dehydrogenase [Amaricoccus sp.]HMR52886.1 acyl-CoA dehydrogenase [Amaricoccus sp.]HMT97735.1 acyl-CoA dehydrogenase [Amaricoccus sp.]
MTETGLRKRYLSGGIFRWARGALPQLSETERAALEAGDVWWDAALFTGSPKWEMLLETAKPELTEREQAFLEGPCAELCDMLDDWRITWKWRDLPPEVWAFLGEHRFFGMIIPEEHGGLGFSAYAQSEVIRRISTRSVTAAVTVMVPNSLGPGELLLQYGTEEQKAHWLPRLAGGREIPAFGLTSPEAGSDAAAMTDEGIVCRGDDGTLGMRLNWHKRYITLGPVATVLGLAFKMRDPDRLLGGEEELGITVALVPTDTPGVEIGRRHLPCMQAFQNGPNRGHDVFLPLDAVLGGRDCIGQGWKMLMSALAAGRGISLPSLSAAAAALSARTTGAYARVREQFGVPIGKFEGVQLRLARLAATAYQLDAARRLTCAGLDEGRKLAVISAIVKAHATWRMRIAVDDAMDVHAGKTVIDGPANYLGNLYRAIPVGITVEGANILTQNLIIFGQGAIRCHPYLLDEMMALERDDLDAFDRAFWGHVGHGLRTFFAAWLRAWSGARFGPVPAGSGPVLRRHYLRLSRYAAAFAVVADIALLTLGGGLKRRELISARLGDVLSELYLLSAVLKRFEDDGRPEADLPLVACCMATGTATIERRLDATLRALPNRPLAWLARVAILPRGPRDPGPDDDSVRACAELLLEPSEARDRLTAGVHCGGPEGGIRDLEAAFDAVVATEPARRKLREARADGIDDAVERGVLNEEAAERLRDAAEAVAKVVAVDDFAPQELSPLARDSEQPRARRAMVS